MDVLLVEPRSEDVVTQRELLSIDAAIELSQHAEVRRVRCLVPAVSDAEAARIEALSTPAGVHVRAVVSPWPAFHRVIARLDDPVAEAVLSKWLRDDLPHVVHTFDVGLGGSCLTGWVADRLGAPAISSTTAAAVLCARGSLIDWTGRNCTDWSRPERCAACCRQPAHAPGVGSARRSEGLSVVDARRAQRWAWLGRWSRFPVAGHFAIRREALLGGLVWSRRVTVPSERDRELLVASGLPRASVVVLDGGPTSWLSLYRELQPG